MGRPAWLGVLSRWASGLARVRSLRQVLLHRVERGLDPRELTGHCSPHARVFPQSLGSDPFQRPPGERDHLVESGVEAEVESAIPGDEIAEVIDGSVMEDLGCA